MVEVYLNVQERQVSFLSIPYSDVQRLSIRPFKWLRFVMFSICGTCGDLSATPDGPPVDYNSTELAENGIYYYKPQGDFIFVDYNMSNDQITFSHDEEDWDDMQQDGFCVITGARAEICEATDIIPRCKGDEFIQRVIRDRSPLYGSTLPSISNTCAVENSVLLTRTAHLSLRSGAVAFLKTPNFVSGLQPTDIQRVNQRPTCTDHFTLQQLERPPGYSPQASQALACIPNLPPAISFAAGLNVDAIFPSESSSPSTIILDYMYGVTAYKCWGSRGAIQDLVENSHREHGETGNIHDSVHPTSPQQRLSITEGIMEKTMDQVLMLFQNLQATTQDSVVDRQVRQMEEGDLKA